MENQQEPTFYTEDDLLKDTIGLTPTDEFAALRLEGYSVEFGDTFNSSWNFIKSYLGQLAIYTLFCITDLLFQRL